MTRLEQIQERIDQLAREGAEHIESWKQGYGHSDGPDVECAACDDIFGQAALLKDALELMASNEAELQRWRGWAQFVYQCGGPITMNDAEQRAAVCEAHDADRDELQTQIGELETEIAAMRQQPLVQEPK